MTTANVLGFSENTGTMTFEQGLAFIERTRRQLDRFEALPHAPEDILAPEDMAAIRRQCDELEADIYQSFTGTMTFERGLAFIERTRRQLDRFEALPHAPEGTLARDDRAAIRRQCDELEADINQSLSNT